MANPTYTAAAGGGDGSASKRTGLHPLPLTGCGPGQETVPLSESPSLQNTAKFRWPIAEAQWAVTSVFFPCSDLNRRQGEPQDDSHGRFFRRPSTRVLEAGPRKGGAYSWADIYLWHRPHRYRPRMLWRVALGGLRSWWALRRQVLPAPRQCRPRGWQGARALPALTGLPPWV